ncbi:MAG: hypothetical protein J6V23_03365, partial [Bacteroidaceae bacterium]|nr:hypothetical protein [Bacteroidaceae bacterium]
MRKFTFFLAMLVAMVTTSMAQSYEPTETRLTSSDLNSKTEPTLIAIKNLSATNNYWFVGNTGAAPYSAAEFSDVTVFVWQPVNEGEAGSYYLMKLDGTYMQATSPKDFGTADNAAVFTTTNPTTDNGEFNGDGDSMSYIDDQALLVRFTNAAGTWINVQNGDSGTPGYNSGKGGWTIHYVYAVEESAVEPEPEPEPTAGFVHNNTELVVYDATELPEGAQAAKDAENTGENCGTNTVKYALVPVNAPAAGNVTITFQYQSGNHKLVILGVDVLGADNNVVASDYHYGFTGGAAKDNTYTIEGLKAGDYQLRYIFCHKADDHEAGNQVAEITVTGVNKREVVAPEPEPEPEDPTALKVYQITAKDAARGALYATTEDTHLTHCGATYGNYHNRDIAINAEDVNQQFVFIEYEGMTYLYCLGAKKFASKDGQYVKLTEIPEGYVTVTDADIAGYKLILFNGQNRLNFSGGYDH